MSNVLRTATGYGASLAVPAAMILLLLLVSPETRTTGAVLSLLQQAFAPAILGWGMLLIMQAGNWDFSIGARVVITAIIAGNVAVQYGVGIGGFIVLSMIISIVVAMVVGYAYRWLRVPTLIVSIGIMLILESITRIVYNGAGVHFTAPYMILGTFPWNLVMFLISFAIAWWLYYKRRLGYSIRAVGSNPTVAQTNGINAVATKANALIASGIFAGLFAILSTSTTGVTAAVSGTMGSLALVFDAMMCVLIGMAIAGKGSMIWAIYAGAIATQILKMWMMATGLPTTYNKVVIGLFVVFFMVSSSRSDLFRRISAWVRGRRIAGAEASVPTGAPPRSEA